MFCALALGYVYHRTRSLPVASHPVGAQRAGGAGGHQPGLPDRDQTWSAGRRSLVDWWPPRWPSSGCGAHRRRSKPHRLQ